MSEIKAIETIYNGYKFRSRLEARWAVFFDNFGIKYEYEPEGFEGDGWRYLPDFYLPQHFCFAEIKSERFTSAEIKKCLDFALDGDKSVVVFIGYPDQFHSFIFNRIYSEPWVIFKEEWDQDAVERALEGTAGAFSDDLLATRCLTGNSREVHFAESIVTGTPLLVPSNTSNAYSRMREAARIAKQARFEFGQTPAKPRGT